MGTSRWDSDEWTSYSSRRITGSSVEQIYSSNSLNRELDPARIDIRESRDSSHNPESNAIIIALDVTGSMSSVLDACVRRLGDLVTEIHNKKPVSDPHIMFMGVGDVECDQAPLQVTQFEADLKIAEQLTNIYLERGGGGNNYESYTLPWVFASQKTSIDCFEKRQKKGYLFTLGDECPTPILRKKDISRLGLNINNDLSTEEALAAVEEKYNIFHVMVGNRPTAIKQWTNLLGQRAVHLPNVTQLPEIIVSTMQLNEGMSREDIIESWTGDSKATVEHSLRVNLR